MIIDNHDRIHLRTAHYNYAKHLESKGYAKKLSKKIQNYQNLLAIELSKIQNYLYPNLKCSGKILIIVARGYIRKKKIFF